MIVQVINVVAVNVSSCTLLELISFRPRSSISASVDGKTVHLTVPGKLRLQTFDLDRSTVT